MVRSDPSSQLLSDETKYGNMFREHLLEQYKLYVQMADNISNRRSIANGFFLTINTFLLSGLSLVSSIRPNSGFSPKLFPIFAAIAGIAFCLEWSGIVRSYRNLNRVKFEVVRELEPRLPAALYGTEWRILTSGSGGRKYKELTEVEKWVPVIFISLYIIYGLTSAIFSGG